MSDSKSTRRRFFLGAGAAVVGLAITEWVARLNSRLLPAIPYRFSLDTSPDATVVGFAATVSMPSTSPVNIASIPFVSSGHRWAAFVGPVEITE